MVLNYGNFLGLSIFNYRAKLRGRTVEDLKKQKIQKIRGQFVSLLSVTSGISWAYFTMSGSLIVLDIENRKWRVVNRKLKLIREELICRDEPIHKVTRKDVMTPLISSAIGTAVGASIDVGIGSLSNISDLSFTYSGGNLMTTLQAMFSKPSSAAHGFIEGATVELTIRIVTVA